MIDAAQRYWDTHEKTAVSSLLEFLRIPSISTDPEHKESVYRAAEWVAQALRSAGVQNVALVRTAGHPLIVGDWLLAGDAAPTVLIYGHYDVQPPDPLELWVTPPFEPDIRDGYIYARGSSDNKGQIFSYLPAIEAYLKTAKKLPINVRFLIEGEEESGGKSIKEFIRNSANRQYLKADFALVSDTSMPSIDCPAITCGLRGICYVEVLLKGPARDLHSGEFGGTVYNPANALCEIIAALRDPKTGRVLIPHFYDRVAELSAEERKLLLPGCFDEESVRRTSGVPSSWGEVGYTLVERRGSRPTLDVNGICSGYTGPGAKTVIPAAASAKISMRLVPNQDPEEIAELFKSYLLSLAPPQVSVEVNVLHGSHPSILDITSPAVRAAHRALERTFGKAPLYERCGGSIPIISDFQRELGLQSVLMGFGLPDDNIHSPNERFSLAAFRKGVSAIIDFFGEYGGK